jgi:hypothetical protein
MKMKFIAISAMSAALLIVPTSMRADDDDKDVKVKVGDKTAEAQQKTHEKICQGHHGTITAKSDSSVTIDGKQYALTVDTQVNKQGEALISKSSKVGDTVCFTTEKAADGSMQISKLIAIDKDEKVRVRDKELDSPSKVEVETPNKKIEVK